MESDLDQMLTILRSHLRIPTAVLQLSLLLRRFEYRLKPT